MDHPATEAAAPRPAAVIVDGKLPPEIVFQLARGLVNGMKQRQHTPREALDILFVAVQLTLADAQADQKTALAVFDHLVKASRWAIEKIYAAPPSANGQPQS